MSDDFIPLNQSTPVQGRWQQKSYSQQNSFSQQNSYSQHNSYSQQNSFSQQNSYQNNWRPRNNRREHDRPHNRWSYNSHQSKSFGSDSNGSYSRENQGIDAYLHPSMLQDPWAHLRQANQ